MKIKGGFKAWFQYNGTALLKGWLRAKEDGNDEDFGRWVDGEYDTFLRDRRTNDGYEIPYMEGIADHASRAEGVIFGKVEYELTFGEKPGLYNIHAKYPDTPVLHTGKLVDCENWIKERQK